MNIPPVVLPQGIRMNFHQCAVESVLTYGLLLWFSSCTKAELKALHRVVKTVGMIAGISPPVSTTIFTSILQERSHPTR